MQECKFRSDCTFFADKVMGDLAAVRSMLKKQYCYTDGMATSCAIYRAMLLVGKERVPLDMFPNQHERIEEVVRGGVG